MRTGDIVAGAAQSAFSNLDQWIERVAERIEIRSSDVVAAAGFLRRLDLTLRTPDALNIALCRRANAVLATFDAKMATVARTLGLEVAEG